ncbi:MAG: tRNA guanosine(34) transglycosylase Tgt [Oscillospiraceae bacterium]
MYKLIKTNGGARRGEFSTNRGTFQTPAFMNVATAGAIKGGLNAGDLLDIGCQVMLCNTYHLHLRPGDELVRKLGGLHEFTRWNGPILTDSGGFQVFSLAKIRKITEEGISFASHIDGRRVFMSPEDSIRIQSNLGSTIAMALDECIENPSPRDYVERSCARTVRWLERCLSERDNLARDEKAINSEQLLFGINQGGCFSDIRVANMREIADIPCDGYAIGGLAVGESANEMYGIIEDVEPHMPRDKIRYLMGVGTPTNIIEAVARGVDLFDCVMPARNGRHGHIFTWDGVLNLNNAKYENDPRVMDERCSCPVCRAGYTRAYMRHLIKAREMLALRMAVIHNLYFYNDLLREIRASIDRDEFAGFRGKYSAALDKRL